MICRDMMTGHSMMPELLCRLNGSTPDVGRTADAPTRPIIGATAHVLGDPARSALCGGVLWVIPIPSPIF